MIKISFDFDGTLGQVPYVQRLALDLSKDPNNELHIITRRYGYIHPEAGDEISQVLQIASALKIPKERIHFTNREYKVNKIIELGIDLHWDDDFTELKLIRELSNCTAFLVK